MSNSKKTVSNPKYNLLVKVAYVLSALVIAVLVVANILHLVSAGTMTNRPEFVMNVFELLTPIAIPFIYLAPVAMLYNIVVICIIKNRTQKKTLLLLTLVALALELTAILLPVFLYS